MAQIQIHIEEAPTDQYHKKDTTAAAAAAANNSIAAALMQDLGDKSGELIAMDLLSDGTKPAADNLAIPNHKRRSSDTSMGSCVSFDDETTWSDQSSAYDELSLSPYHLQVPGPRLHRSASAGAAQDLCFTRSSSICSEIAIHDEDGNVAVFNKRRLPGLLKGHVPRGAVCIRDAKAREHGKRRSEAKMAQKSSYIVLLFLVLWMPLPIFVAFSNYHVDNHTNADRIQLFLDLQVCAFCFGTLSAATNPIIYGLAIKSFRNAFHRLALKYRRKVYNKWKL